MNYLVTGCAGFIGFHVTQRLLRDGHHVVGVDNLNDYYDPALKQARLDQIGQPAGFTFVRQDIADQAAMQQVFATHQPDIVIHLAAQAGVRYSLENPHAYAQSNLVGFLTILEGCRAVKVKHLVYASSSSVYGLDRALPYSEHQGANHPVSLYAATKRANELMAHSYAHLFHIPCTGLRFFTVYGPWGRPDMSPWIFADAISQGKPITLFNNGNMQRDFTYVDDVVEGVVRVAQIPAVGVAQKPAGAQSATSTPSAALPATDAVPLLDQAQSSAPWQLFNLGNNNPITLRRYVQAFERAFGCEAHCDLLPMQPGDVVATCADTQRLAQAVGYRPDTDIDSGVKRFVEWYQQYHKTNP